MSEATTPHPIFIPALVYRDNGAALQWLQRAFGFEVHVVMTDATEQIVHAEMRFGNGLIMIGHEWADWTRSPASIGGSNTQRLFVRLTQAVDEHCERARSAGARIVMPPTDQFYGERSYMAQDLEGHHWTFTQTVKTVSAADMEAASGFKLRSRP